MIEKDAVISITVKQDGNSKTIVNKTLRRIWPVATVPFFQLMTLQVWGVGR